MQKLISIKIKRDETVLNFASALANQTVPVVVSNEDDIANFIKDELQKLNLVLLHQEGVIPAGFLSAQGYESSEVLLDSNELVKEYELEFSEFVESLSARLRITEFKLAESETVCKITAERTTGSVERSTRIAYNAFDLYENENEKYDTCLFAEEILTVHSTIQEEVQKCFVLFASNVHTESEVLDV
jgi:hypothetical protein